MGDKYRCIGGFDSQSALVLLLRGAKVRINITAPKGDLSNYRTSNCRL